MYVCKDVCVDDVCMGVCVYNTFVHVCIVCETKSVSGCEQTLLCVCVCMCVAVREREHKHLQVHLFALGFMNRGSHKLVSDRDVGHVNVQMRKFVAKYSAGLRVRAHPTLQSEQLGVIKPEGVISFVEEVSDVPLASTQLLS